MKILQTIANFLKGSYARFGTTNNLIRELTLSVITAVVVATLVRVLTPPEASPISEVRDLIKQTLQAQHSADQASAKLTEWKLHAQIDSLTQITHTYAEQDSMRANARLSDVDAMRAINRAIAKKAHR